MTTVSSTTAIFLHDRGHESMTFFKAGHRYMTDLRSWIQVPDLIAGLLKHEVHIFGISGASSVNHWTSGSESWLAWGPFSAAAPSSPRGTTLLASLERNPAAADHTSHSHSRFWEHVLIHTLVKFIRSIYRTTTSCLMVDLVTDRSYPSKLLCMNESCHSFNRSPLMSNKQILNYV